MLAWLRKFAAVSVVSLVFLVNTPSSQALELVLFGASWCTPCHAFQAEVLPHYSSTYLGSRIPITYVDASQQDDIWFNLDERVANLPAFVLVEDGQELSRFYGYSGIENFFFRLAQAAEGHF